MLPAAFIGHGSPTNTLADNRFTRAWRAFAAEVGTPRAVVMISAHWYAAVTAVTAMEQPRTIHDLFGAADELRTFHYAAPGSQEVARAVRDAVRPRYVGLDDDAWGIDHGAWSVLAHMFPAADVPVVQLAINGTKDYAYHLEIGARLAPLREQGVLVIGSSNVVHNLGRTDASRGDEGFDWAVRFDEAARAILTTRPGDVLELLAHPDAHLAVPTPDHFIPLVYIAGLAGGRPLDVLVDGYAQGSMSMTSYVLR